MYPRHPHLLILTHSRDRPVDAAAREREITEKMEKAKLAASAARQNTNSRPASRQGSRQGSRAGSPTRSPAVKPVGLGLNTGDNAADAAPGTPSVPGTPNNPKILPRSSGAGPSGRGGGPGGGFGHGRAPSEGGWRRGGAANRDRDQPASSNAGNTNNTGGEDSRPSKPSGGTNNGGSGMERRASTVRPSFSFANAAAGATTSTNK
jgi:hypothetical protein